MTALVTGPPLGAPAFDEAVFRKRCDALLVAAGVPDAELSVALVADDEIADLNVRHRGRPGPTDVLSFSLREGEHTDRSGGMLGDVVIAVTVAHRQAREIGHDLDEELLRLLIHGVLHLLGFDHEEADEARAMQSRERELRAAIS